MGSGEEQDATVALGGDAVAMAVRDGFEESMVWQPAKVVGGLSTAEPSRAPSKKRLEVFAQVTVCEAAGQQPEHAQDREQGLDAVVGEAHASDALTGLGVDRLRDRGERGGAIGGGVGGVLVDALGVKETSVG